MSGAPRVLDLRHLGRERQIAVFVLETVDGPALVDCGPSTCLDVLRFELRACGLAVADLRHLFVTHVHIDHAGAAGALVREQPELVVHCSAAAGHHLADPTRLEASARRVFGTAFDQLWGRVEPVPAARIVPDERRPVGLEAIATPGHAAHHVAYLSDDGTLFCGDVAGVRSGGAYVYPPTPPPEIDLDAWSASLERVERLAPARLAVAHFGIYDDVVTHLDSLRATLARWDGRIATGMDAEPFVAAALAEEVCVDGRSTMSPDALRRCHSGLLRYRERLSRAGHDHGREDRAGQALA
jgi:glyoxylase-like metal-dependent hydrolase (beta-lactamase superfamily II)